MIKFLKKFYFSKPKVARLLFGVDPDLMSVKDLKSSLLWLRVYMWLWVLIAVFVVFGVLMLKGELNSCMSGLPLKACMDALSICNTGAPLASLNISLVV